MKNWIQAFGYLAFLLIPGSAFAQDSQGQNDPNVIHWYSVEEAVALTQQAPRPIFIDVYTDWCGWCKRMDATTFRDTTIARTINTLYYPVKLDAEYKGDIQVGNRTYTFVPQGRRGYNEIAAELLSGSMSYPSYAFINPDLSIITVVKGYQDVGTLYPILLFIAEKKYENQTWEDYLANFNLNKN
jgi:thioredoxin-related protein